MVAARAHLSRSLILSVPGDPVVQARGYHYPFDLTMRLSLSYLRELKSWRVFVQSRAQGR